MVDNKKSSATTASIKNGEIKIAKITIPKKKPLFILIVYGGGGEADFLAAAEYKEQRIKQKYPDAEVEYVDKFKHVHEFTAKWTKLYQKLCTKELQARFDLWEVHYFGHGENEILNFRDFEGKNSLTFGDIDKLEVLPWHPYNGIFVLHSCRSGAFEDSFDADKIKKQICLAQHISKKQQTRCLGQVVYANFSHQPSQRFNQAMLSTNTTSHPIISVSPISEEEKQDAIKYRPNKFINAAFDLYNSEKVLWGYALLTGDTGDKIRNNSKKYQNSKSIKNAPLLPQEYPILSEVKLLADNNQILPCRVFNNGELDEQRRVAVDVFNDNDLEYI